ncbi:MAG: succinate dehydrogenase, cytochrome b556 subunit [Rickettsiaceae bacterium]|nr:succinate dehydrogenase, cytochrome b556 subunit [Rickettsiaceae bacterium]
MNNEEKIRPISPHLGIYKHQITSVLSIAHRITGFILFCSFIIISWWLILAIFSDFRECYFKLFSCNMVKLGLLGMLFSLFYHTTNGVRHLCWDLGYGFEIKTVEKTGWTVVLVSILSTLLFWLIS